MLIEYNPNNKITISIQIREDQKREWGVEIESVRFHMN